MARLILHIGPPKTATTHIQETLAHNRAALEHAGIAYPLDWAGGKRSEHHHALMRDLQAAFGDHGDPPEPESQAAIDGWLAGVAASNKSAYVMSSEGFPSVKTPAWVAFAAMAASHGIALELAVVLRSPEKWIVSAWSQQLKLGDTWSLPAFLVRSAAERNGFPRWGEMFRRLSPAIAANQFHIAVLDDLTIDVVTWLCSDVIGVDVELEEVVAGRKNERLSTAAAETLRVATIAHQQRFPDEPPDAMWAHFNAAYFNHHEELLKLVQRVDERMQNAPTIPVSWFGDLCRPDHDQLLDDYGHRVRRDHDGDGLFPDVSHKTLDRAIHYVNCTEELELFAEIDRVARHLVEPPRGRRLRRR